MGKCSCCGAPRRRCDGCSCRRTDGGSHRCLKLDLEKKSATGPQGGAGAGRVDDIPVIPSAEYCPPCSPASALGSGNTTHIVNVNVGKTIPVAKTQSTHVEVKVSSKTVTVVVRDMSEMPGKDKDEPPPSPPTAHGQNDNDEGAWEVLAQDLEAEL